MDANATELKSGNETCDALVQLLTERDPHLASHVSNVTTLATETARRLSLDTDLVHRVRLTAQLHDVGKVAIPSSIFEKSGPLSDDEWGLVKQHPLIGERILTSAPSLAVIAPLVRATHERMDGRGYPDGRGGDDIPLESRIVAVTDAFDAMTTHRPHRRALTVDAALSEIELCSGAQFDPEVVRAFVDVVRGGQGVLEQSGSPGTIGTPRLAFGSP
jgi:HD-GYP domain-containing protein (c-di-GMP phosphodiesterase class II)